jgi:serine/threonine-protein kinase
MATVYLARLGGAGGFQRFVAIKRLHPHLAKDNEFTQMFLDEARLAARLHHPNVVPILEIGESVDGYYLVMEYIEGDTLARILARSAQAGRALPPKVAIRACLDALLGLHTAHELCDDDGKPLFIVHRDVSPQNILVGVDGTSRIADFGVARATSRLSTTRTGQLKGKLAYMAPEQARGKEVDRRADVFAMGIVTWEALGQKRLFKGEGEADTLNRVLYEPIPKLRAANPTVPAELEAVVMKALDRDPDQRWATAADFADALEKAARTVGVLGTSRDVQQHLDAVLGTDISQQRDAVRAWLARSEPSQRMSGAMLAHANSVTKVEGARPTGPDGSGQQNSVSSVSSAVIALPGSATSSPSSPSSAQPLPVVETLPSKKRSKGWALVAVVVLLLAVGGPIAFLRFRGSAALNTTSAPAATNPTPTTTETAKVDPTPATVAATVPAPSASAAASVGVSTIPAATTTTKTGVLHVPTGRPTATGKPTSTAQATATATATAQATATATSTGGGLDDIGKNPYR